MSVSPNDNERGIESKAHGQDPDEATFQPPDLPWLGGQENQAGQPSGNDDVDPKEQAAMHSQMTVAAVSPAPPEHGMGKL